MLNRIQLWTVRSIIISGPAFQAGRYGFACVEVMHYLSQTLNLPCIGGMHIENPEVDSYKKYKDLNVYIISTAADVSGMEEALSAMSRLFLNRASGATLGSASEDGYIPRGVRVIDKVDKPGKQRAIEMLLDKLAGRPFNTEIPIEKLEAVPIPAQKASMHEVI